MNEPRLLIDLCTYNERENIQRLIPDIHRVVPEADVLVVDDGSPDGTGELADSMAASDSRIHVLHRAGKLGLGTAILAAVEYAIHNDYDLLLNMDADLSHNPQYIPALLDCMNRVDVSIGSRYLPTSKVEDWGFHRYLMSRTVNWYARLLLGLKLADSSNSFRCYRVAKLRQLDLKRFRARGYAFQQEMLYRCQRAGCRFEETPTVYPVRRLGRSKVSWREIVSSLWVIFRLGVDNLRGVPVTVDESGAP